MDLFEERGYDVTTMDEIAAAAQVSRQTLFRLFPAKADLVWGELDDHLWSAFDAAARDPEPHTLREIVHRVFRTPESFRQPAIADEARRHLRLIGRTPSLMHHPTLDLLNESMTRAVARATDLTAPPELVSRGLVAVGVAALTWWADQDSVEDASTVLDLALHALGAAASGESGS